MIIQEEIKINDTFYMYTYSDQGFMIEREGVLYEDAIDPSLLGRTYIETTQKREQDDLIFLETLTLE
jgi:hypothetical protein